MTKKQYEYKWRQYQLRYNCDNRICQYKNCFKKVTQIAHRISQSKVNIKKYGWEVIQHNFNLVSVCCLEHNDYFNCGFNPAKSEKLVKLIKERGNEYFQVSEINNYLEL